jgi:hypothetical protein
VGCADEKKKPTAAEIRNERGGIEGESCESHLPFNGQEQLECLETFRERRREIESKVFSSYPRARPLTCSVGLFKYPRLRASRCSFLSFDGLALSLLFFLKLVLYFGVRNRKPRVDLCGLVNHPSNIAKVRRENSKPSVRCGVFLRLCERVGGMG